MSRTNDWKVLGLLLGEIAQRDHSAGRGLRTALAVRREKDGPFEPNDAFYDWASELGLDVSDRSSPRSTAASTGTGGRHRLTPAREQP